MTSDPSNKNTKTLRIFVIRHGQTNNNLHKVLQGHMDIPINQEGIQQSQKAGKYLSTVQFDYFVTSDLSRCVATTNEILKYQGTKCGVRTTPNIRERDMGIVQGLPIAEALKRYGSNFRDMGEPHAKLIERLSKEWDLIVEEGLQKGYLNIGVCTHGGVVINLLNYLYDNGYKLGKGLSKLSLQKPINTSISVIDIDTETKEGTIEVFGGVEHLTSSKEFLGE